MIRRRILITVTLMTTVTLSALAAAKDSGTTTLKDIQPAGLTDKSHKNQVYDLSFASSAGKDYTCRTSEKKSIKATDLVVGSNLSYQIDGDKAKVKTSAGKQLDCKIVRVALASPAPQ